MDNLVVVMALTTVAAAAGTILRYVLDGFLNNEFPLGTLLVNLMASLALGIIVAADDPLPTIVGIGALGALSTWATAANEAAEMTRTDRAALGITYLILTATSGVLFAWFGLRIGPVLF